MKVPIPHQDPIDNLKGTGIQLGWDLISIKLGLDFDQARTRFNQAESNSAMTHVGFEC
jgi:hypothetical protein